MGSGLCRVRPTRMSKSSTTLLNLHERNNKHFWVHSSSAIVSRLSCSLVGEERTIQSVPDTKFSSICGLTPFSGYHYCNFGLSDKFIRTLCDYGLTIGATAEDAGTEAIELSDHAFFMATLFQPQMGTQLRGELHPLISQFLAAADS